MFTFYAMSKKGYEVLCGLVNNNFTHLIDCVVSATDKNVSKDYYREIKELCIEKNIRFYDRRDEIKESSKFSFAISWRWLIKKQNLIILHDSLLPKYRGFNPLVSALINGDTEIGVTAIFANEEYDTGDIIDQNSITITYPIKINEVIEIISGLYTKIVIRIISLIASGKQIQGIFQDNSKATYSLWRDEKDYRINWDDKSVKIERFINALGFPYKGAFTTMDNKVVRILDVDQVEEVIIENRNPGKVIFIKDGFPIVVCGEGLLQIKNITWDDGSSVLPLKNFRTRFG